LFFGYSYKNISALLGVAGNYLIFVMEEAEAGESLNRR
jgi:hypothetical protein